MNFKDLKEYFTPKNLFIAGATAISLSSLYLIVKNYGKGQPNLKDSSTQSTIPIKREIAEIWKTNISNLSYELQLFLPSREDYQGHVIIMFELKETIENFFIPFQGSEISDIFANGRNLKKESSSELSIFRDQRIYISRKFLEQGQNRIEVTFRNKYSDSGYGLSRIIDYDGLEYIYSNCEPCAMHTVFPCFDVIFIRAVIKLEVIAPQDSKVISNEAVTNTSAYLQLSTLQKFNINEEKENYMIHEFHKTQPIPEYMFTIACGPFYELTQLECPTVPATLYIKRSLKSFLDEQKDELFFLVYHGIKFFEEYTGVEYPFSKYDHVIVPDFPSCAMENPGCVLVDDEAFIFRSKPSWSQEIRRAYIILHEMAHMWFGDLINLDWYDCMWLKESFASLFGYLAIINTPELKNRYPRCLEHRELYEEPGIIWDQFSDMVHSITEVHIADTVQALSAFDDLIYHKGCGVLHVLYQRLGDNLFKNFIQQYTQKMVWKTANNQTFFEDFKAILQNMQLPEDLDISHFIENWLQSKGTDMIRVATNHDGTLGFNVVRFGEGRRDHKFKTLITKKNSDTPIYLDTYISSDVSTVWTDFKTDELEFILPNYGGLDYVITKLDDNTIDKGIKKSKTLRDINSYTELFFWRKLTFLITIKECAASRVYDILKIIKSQFSEGDQQLQEILIRIYSSLSQIQSSLLEKIQKNIFDIWIEDLNDGTVSLAQALPLLLENCNSDNSVQLHKWFFSESMVLRSEPAKELFLKALSEFPVKQIEDLYYHYSFEGYEERIKRLSKIFHLAKRPLVTLNLMDLFQEVMKDLRPREIHLYISLLRRVNSAIFEDSSYTQKYLEWLPAVYLCCNTKKFQYLMEDFCPALNHLEKETETITKYIKNPEIPFLISYFLKEKKNQVALFIQKPAF